MTADADYARTKYEVELDIDYAIRLACLHERLYGRVHKNLRLIQLIGGSAALVSAVGGHQQVVMAVAGVVLAAIAYINLIFDFSERARAHRDYRRKLTTLLAEADQLSQADLQKKLTNTSFDEEVVIEGLRKPAYNQNLQRHGRYSHTVALSRWERFMQAIS